ncbi:MAG: alanine racemase [Desulfobacteraceae bacterium]|nr:alanine racemase [Desulfobacteraceae bacterium]
MNKKETSLKKYLAWVEINLGAIRHNVKALKKTLGRDVKFMAVVKADGYGHGSIKVAKVALKNGATWLGVARLAEAVKLREAKIKAPILVFGSVRDCDVELVAKHDLTITLFNQKMTEEIALEALRQGVYIKAHLKVDTGMGRLGLLPDHLRASPALNNDAAREIRLISELENIKLEGIYTHLASADSEDKTYTEYQLENFNLLLEELVKNGVSVKICHVANSACIIDLPQVSYDMVRAGISIYGLYPSSEVYKTNVMLKPAMSLKSVITSLKEMPAGFKISYGMTYTTQITTKIAIVPVGYADGLPRLLSSNGHMLVRGKRAPIAGRVCMDQTMIDVGHIPMIQPGDEVVIIGKQGKEEITADEVANNIGTINYEIVSRLSTRLPRVYSGLLSSESG